MTLRIALPIEEHKRLSDRAAAAGREVDDYVHDLIKRDIGAAPSIIQAAEPFARAVAASGMSDEEFDAFIEQSRQEIWDERRAKSS